MELREKYRGGLGQLSYLQIRLSGKLGLIWNARQKHEIIHPLNKLFSKP